MFLLPELSRNIGVYFLWFFHTVACHIQFCFYLWGSFFFRIEPNLHFVEPNIKNLRHSHLLFSPTKHARSAVMFKNSSAILYNLNLMKTKFLKMYPKKASFFLYICLKWSCINKIVYYKLSFIGSTILAHKIKVPNCSTKNKGTFQKSCQKTCRWSFELLKA